MLNNYNFRFEYLIDGKLFVSDKKENEHYSVSSVFKNKLFTLKLVPKTKIEMKRCSIIYDYSYGENSKVFANGYQSWTTSREYRKGDTQKGLKGLAKYYPVKVFCQHIRRLFLCGIFKQAGVFPQLYLRLYKKRGRAYAYRLFDRKTGLYDYLLRYEQQ